MTAIEIIPDCWINIEDSIETEPCWESLFCSEADSLAHIRLEGSPIWNGHPDGFNIASAKWYQTYLKERERQRSQNTAFVARTVRDVIPQSRLATYGNFEYDEERESKYKMCVNVPYSVDVAYGNLCRDGVQEIWMSPVVEYMMLMYLSPTGDPTGSFSSVSPPGENADDILGASNPRLYKVDNSQHFELEMKIQATKDIWSRETPPISPSMPDWYPVAFNPAPPILTPRPHFVPENSHPTFTPPNTFPFPNPSHPLQTGHDVTFISPYKSTLSSSDSSTCSCTSPLHPIYQQQRITPKLLQEFNLETADMSKFLLFTLDVDGQEDCVLQTIDRVSTWLNQVYPNKHAQKLEVEKQLLASYTYSTSNSVTGPRKILFCPPLSDTLTELPRPETTPQPRRAPSQVKSTPFTTPVTPSVVKNKGNTTPTAPRHLSLPLSFSAVTKGCSKKAMEPCLLQSGDKKPITDIPLACTARKSRSKHRPPHPTDPTRPSGVYTTLSGYKYYSPPRPRGASDEK